MLTSISGTAWWTVNRRKGKSTLKSVKDHALPHVILKRLLPDLAMQIYTGEKAFSLKRRPDSETYAKVSAITPDKYNIVTTGLVMRFLSVMMPLSVM